MKTQDLRKFAKGLKQIGIDYQCYAIFEYSTILETQIESFDLEHLPQTMESFAQVIDTLTPH